MGRCALCRDAVEVEGGTLCNRCAIERAKDPTWDPLHKRPWNKGVKPEPDEEFQVVMTVFVKGLGKDRHTTDTIKTAKRALHSAFGKDHVRVDHMQTLKGAEMVGDMGWVKDE